MDRDFFSEYLENKSLIKKFRNKIKIKNCLQKLLKWYGIVAYM